tara:strand:+ start:211 stop:342 length:132 start_codon:yes stop_codon:yes gene_type:complete
MTDGMLRERDRIMYKEILTNGYTEPKIYRNRIIKERVSRSAGM